MVAIIVNQRDRAARLAIPAGQGQIAIALKTPSDAAEFGQGFLHGSVFNIQFHRHGNRRQGVEHIVQARQIQHHIHVRQHHAIAALHDEVHLCADGSHIDSAHLGVLVETVTGNRAGHVVDDVAHRRIVGAQNGSAIKGHAVQKIDKGFFETVEVVAIGFHVVGVDIRHHRHHRQQVQERCVRLIGLHHDVLTAAQSGIGTRAIEASTNDKGRVQTGLCKHAGHQAGGGGLAMGAGNRNALLEAHQLGQHQGARHDGNVHLAGANHLGVVLLDGGGRHHRIGAGDMVGAVAYIGGDAKRCQAFGGGVVGQVGARNGVAQIAQHLGNAGHARAAHADEMNVLDGVFHTDPFISSAFLFLEEVNMLIACFIGLVPRKRRPPHRWRAVVACVWLPARAPARRAGLCWQ